MITTENIRQATEAFRDESVHNMYSDFSDDIEELFDDKVGEWLTSQFDENDEMGAGEIASALCEWVADDMEHTNDYEGLTHDWTDGRFIYTDDAWDYYRNNQHECDDNLHEIDMSAHDSIDSIVSAVVAIAIAHQAENELIEVIEVIREGAGDMENYLA